MTRQVTKHLAILEEANLLGQRQGRDKLISSTRCRSTTSPNADRQSSAHDRAGIKKSLEGDDHKHGHHQFHYGPSSAPRPSGCGRADQPDLVAILVRHASADRLETRLVVATGLPDGRIADTGEVVEIDPPRRLR
jgi:hypothetical protein